MDDPALTEALARDVDGAFEDLVLAHQDRLYTIALRVLGDPGDAEEAAQDAFVRAYRALGGYPPERIRALALRSWLAAIVVNACRNRRRRIADRHPPRSLTPLLAGGFDPDDPAPSPETISARRGAAAQWANRLAALPRAQRTAVVLRHVDGLAYHEVAAALGVPDGTAKSHVHRGLARLRRIVEAERSQARKELSA